MRARRHTFVLLLALGGGTASAVTCDELREQIAAKFRAGGVADPQLRVVDAAASAPGRTVGTCDRGARRIVHVPGPAGGAARRDDAILTECKDGRVLRGGSCRP